VNYLIVFNDRLCAIAKRPNLSLYETKSYEGIVYIDNLSCISLTYTIPSFSVYEGIVYIDNLSCSTFQLCLVYSCEMRVNHIFWFYFAAKLFFTFLYWSFRLGTVS
jgi:hypothetical protein